MNDLHVLLELPLPPQVHNKVLRKVFKSMDKKYKVILFNLDLSMRNLPRAIRSTILRKLVGGTINLASICSDLHEDNLDICGADLCRNALIECDFINFEGLPLPIDYCQLFKELRETWHALRQHFPVEMSSYNVLARVPTDMAFYLNSYQICTNLSRQEIESLRPQIIDFILQNRKKRGTGDPVVIDHNVINYLQSDTFQTLLRTSPNATLPTLTNYLDNYYVPQSTKDDLAVWLVQNLITDHVNNYLTVLGEMIAKGVNLYRLIPELARRKIGAHFIHYFRNMKLVYFGIREGIINGDTAMADRCLFKTRIWLHNQVNTDLDVGELLALTRYYNSPPSIYEHLKLFATNADILRAHEIYERLVVDAGATEPTQD